VTAAKANDALQDPEENGARSITVLCQVQEGSGGAAASTSITFTLAST